MESALRQTLLTDDEDRVVPVDVLRDFGDLIGELRDIQAIARSIAEELGFPSPRFSLIRLVTAWNSQSQGGAEQITGVAEYIDEGRFYYLNQVNGMQQLVSRMPKLKDVFGNDWFEGLRSEIRAWDGTKSYTTNKFGAFISYLQFEKGNGSLLRELNDAFARLSGAVGKGLKIKLRDMSGKLDAYVSTAFEILVTAKFPNILDYEPKISSGRPEARVRIGNQLVLIEARATLDMELGPNGAFDPDEKGRVLASKAREKYAGQLKGALEPVVLLFGLNYAVHSGHLGAMVRRLRADIDSRVVSAILFSETFHAQQFPFLWINPNANYPLTVDAITELHRLFSLGEVLR